MHCSDDTEREMMKCTIALLLSLATMADHVATRSYLVRCFMLWIFRRAEASAWRYVTGADAPDPGQFILHRNSCAEALHLSDTLRALAQAMKDDLRHDRHFASWWKRLDEHDEPELAWIDAGRRFAFLPQEGSAASSFALAAIGKLSPAPAKLEACRVLPPP